MHDPNRDENRCVLCGKSRQDDTHLRLILGVHGGVCLDCVHLCLELIKTDAVEKELDVPALGEPIAQAAPSLL